MTSLLPGGTLPPPPREWRLHIGVHKTATTHIQDVLAHHVDALRTHGIDHVPVPVLMSKRIPDLRRRNWRAWVGGAVLRDEVLRKTAPFRTGLPTAVLSFEDWIGPSSDGLAPIPYPQAGRRVGTLARCLAETADVTLFMAIRRWDEFLPSAYATLLRFRPVPGGFEPIRARCLASPPDWLDLVDRILAAAPGVKLRLWRYETYRPRWTELLDVLCGRPIGPPPALPDPVDTRTPSAFAVSVAERLEPGLSMWGRRDMVQALYARLPAEGDGKFAPFNPEEAAALNAAYEAQCARIAEKHPGIFV